MSLGSHSCQSCLRWWSFVVTVASPSGGWHSWSGTGLLGWWRKGTQQPPFMPFSFPFPEIHFRRKEPGELSPALGPAKMLARPGLLLALVPAGPEGLSGNVLPPRNHSGEAGRAGRAWPTGAGGQGVSHTAPAFTHCVDILFCTDSFYSIWSCKTLFIPIPGFLVPLDILGLFISLV